MTIMYYLAAPRELPTGTYGLRPRRIQLKDHLRANPDQREQPVVQILLEQDPEGEQWLESYDSELDAAGLTVSGPTRLDELVPMLGQPYVYLLSANSGDFVMDEAWAEPHPLGYACIRKCLTELIRYLEAHVRPGERFVLYRCTDRGWETPLEPPRQELDRQIDLSGYRLGASFAWEERQAIRVTRSQEA